MRRGDVLWVDLGNPPGGSGREQSGDRPSIAISGCDSDPDNPMITIIPLTSSRNASRFPYTVEINPSSQNRLNTVSIAMVFQIRSLDKNRVTRITGHLEDGYIIKIENIIRDMLFLKNGQ